MFKIGGKFWHSLIGNQEFDNDYVIDCCVSTNGVAAFVPATEYSEEAPSYPVALEKANFFNKKFNNEPHYHLFFCISLSVLFQTEHLSTKY